MTITVDIARSPYRPSKWPAMFRAVWQQVRNACNRELGTADAALRSFANHQKWREANFAKPGTSLFVIKLLTVAYDAQRLRTLRGFQYLQQELGPAEMIVTPDPRQGLWTRIEIRFLT